MPHSLLLNPRARTAKRKTRKAPSAAQKRARAKFAAASRARSKAVTVRVSNPKRRSKRAAPRRSNPVVTYRRRARSRRRNPISMGRVFNVGSYIAPLKSAAVMGGGAIGMDYLYAYIQRYLPVQLQMVPGTVGLGNLVKALLTVAAGRALAKPTRGVSNQAAMGALVVQFRDVFLSLMPPRAAAVAATVNGLGWASPAMVVPGSTYTNSRGTPANMGAFVNGPSPMLKYSGSGNMGSFVSGNSPLLASARRRR